MITLSPTAYNLFARMIELPLGTIRDPMDEAAADAARELEAAGLAAPVDDWEGSGWKITQAGYEAYPNIPKPPGLPTLATADPSWPAIASAPRPRIPPLTDEHRAKPVPTPHKPEPAPPKAPDRVADRPGVERIDIPSGPKAPPPPRRR